MHTEGLYWIDNAPDLLEFIELVNHPLFHCVWDTGHANMQDMSQEEALMLLGSHMKALHIQDNNKIKDIHMCPLFGTLDVNSLMTGLKNIGYDGYFTFEAPRFFSPEISFEVDLELKISAEKLMYNIGENILRKYAM